MTNWGVLTLYQRFSFTIKPIIYKHGNMTSVWRQQRQRISNFLHLKCLFSPKHSLKILWKSEHFPQRYKRKHEWVFFLNTVYKGWCHSIAQCTYYVVVCQLTSAQRQTIYYWPGAAKLFTNSAEIMLQMYHVTYRPKRACKAAFT